MFICAATRRPHRAIPSHPRRPISPRGRGKLDRRGRKGSTNVVMLLRRARASWSGWRDVGLPCASGFNFADNGGRRRARQRRSRTRLTSSTITRPHPSLPIPPEVSVMCTPPEVSLSVCLSILSHGNDDFTRHRLLVHPPPLPPPQMRVKCIGKQKYRQTFHPPTGVG